MPNFSDRNYDTVSVSEYDEETTHKMAENELLLRRKSVQDLFEGYEYEEARLIWYSILFSIFTNVSQTEKCINFVMID